MKTSGGKLPKSVHEAQPWVIAQIAPDFRLLDVWALPIEGGPGDFAEALELFADFDPAHSGSAVTRTLFSVRYQLGRWFGWDDAALRRPIPGCTETTLSARLPEDLRGSAKRAEIGEAMQQAAGGFEPLYRTDTEWAAELSNATVHGVLHLVWVEQGEGRWRGHLAVYVKPRGAMGEAYMLFIEPFRLFLVYPALMRQIDRAWTKRSRVSSRR